MFNLEEALKNFKGKYYIPNDDDEVDYKQLYEQQKQRADELEHKLKKEIDESERQLRRWYEELKHADQLEKRWSELRDFLNDGENLYLVDLTRDEVICKMHDLEEESK